jgi:hypothetical protein
MANTPEPAVPTLEEVGAKLAERERLIAEIHSNEIMLAYGRASSGLPEDELALIASSYEARIGALKAALEAITI